MSKQTLYMDYSSSKALQIFLSYLLSNGQVSNDAYYYLFGNEKLSDKAQHIMLHQHFRNFYGMLSVLTLYDEIIIYPIKGLAPIREELLDEMGIHYAHRNKGRLWKNHKSISAEEAENLIRSHKKEILSDFRQEKSFADYWLNYDFDLSDSFEYYLERNYHLDLLPSVKPSANLFSSIERSILGRGPQNLLKTGEYDFMDYLDSTFSCLAGSMGNAHGTFYSSLLSSNNWEKITANECERIDNVVLAADFSGGIGVIPHPETIEEVVAWRKHSDMKAFRSVFSAWIHTLRNGDIALANQMRSDISKASNQLRKLDKYDTLNKNVMVALIKIGLSKVPGADILMTTSDFLTPYITDYQHSKCSWVNLPAFNPIFRTLKHRDDEIENQ